MKVYVHIVTDQAGSYHNDRYFGISTEEDGKGYQEAMDWINAHQEWRGGERYEYEREECELNFVWKLNEDGFEKIRTNEQSPDIFGAVHFGKILVEFRCTGGGYDDENHQCICDTFLFGKYNPDLDYWVNDVPYDMIEDGDPVIPKRRTMAKFRSAFEQNVLEYLNERTDLIKHAVADTVVDEWY